MSGTWRSLTPGPGLGGSNVRRAELLPRKPARLISAFLPQPGFKSGVEFYFTTREAGAKLARVQTSPSLQPVLLCPDRQGAARAPGSPGPWVPGCPSNPNPQARRAPPPLPSHPHSFQSHTSKGSPEKGAVSSRPLVFVRGSQRTFFLESASAHPHRLYRLGGPELSGGSGADESRWEAADTLGGPPRNEEPGLAGGGPGSGAEGADRPGQRVVFLPQRTANKRVSAAGPCAAAEGIIRTRDKKAAEIGNNYFVSVFINENEGH